MSENESPSETFKKIRSNSIKLKEYKEDIYNTMEDILAETEEQLVRKVSQRGRPRKTFNYSPLGTDKFALHINLSDNHFGKLNGNYNLRTAIGAVRTVFSKAKDEAHIYGLNNFDEININLVGDHVDGDGSVYPGQAYNLECSPLEQIGEFTKIIYSELKSFSEIMPEECAITVRATPGNHGKLKGRVPAHPGSNWDLMLYMHIESMLNISHLHNDMKNVTIEYSNSLSGYQYISKGWNVLLRHITVKNLSTTAGQQKLMNLMHNRKLRDQEKRDLDLILTGHFHQSALETVGKARIVRVGCSPGFDDYADELIIADTGAEQSIIIMDKYNLIRNYIPVDVEVYDYEDTCS